VFVALLEEIFQLLPGRTEKNYENSQTVGGEFM
jgi:hypothetical protein